METPEIKETPKLKKVTNSEDFKENIQSQIVIKTEMDAYISELIKGQPQTPEEIKVVNFTPSPGRHRLSLPEQIEKKYGKKYAFRWVNKKKVWIDRATVERGWLIVNRMMFSDMPKHLFTANGTVEIGDTILCFMPMEQAESLRKEPRRISSERVKDLPMEQWKKKGEDSPFYKPTLGQEEKDGEILSAGIQPDIQPITQ